MSSDAERRVDLVLEGGGVKGIGLVGALAALEDRELEPQRIAGTSAGAIVASLLAARYSTDRLHEIMLDLDFEAFKDEAWEDKVPGADVPLSILKDQGIYEGHYVLEWIEHLLRRKGVETFGQLVDPAGGDDPRYRHRLQVIASDITARELLILPRHAKRFGIEPDDLRVADAVRMSMSIPFFFEPWRWRDADGDEHLIVDGGVLSNFPVWLFDSDDAPRWPTFGLRLAEPELRKSVAERLEPDGAGPRAGTIDFVKGLILTMLEAHDRMYLENASFVRTIQIPTLGVRTTEFDLDKKRAEELFESGRGAAAEFLAGWSFPDYVATFREGDPPTRRELVRRAGG
jgi:NTE family protein